MRPTCEYCGADFKDEGERLIHIRDAHPDKLKCESYFQVLLNREANGYYLRQISYARRVRG